MECSSFARLPEGCISEILSHTSALDASRSSIVSKEFESVARNDLVWERFLPFDYQEIISKAASPIKYAAKKELYLSLCESPLLINGGTMSFSIDKRNGGKCFMIGAKELMISWKGCWEFVPNPLLSRFSEVAKLRSIGWIHIQANIKTKILSKNTTYAAYLVFWLESMEGLRSSNTVISYSTPSDGPTKKSSKKERTESRETGKIATKRKDGWLEIEMGKFYNGSSDEGEVEAWLTEINSPYDKSGFVVEGIEFRPL